MRESMLRGEVSDRHNILIKVIHTHLTVSLIETHGSLHVFIVATFNN